MSFRHAKIGCCGGVLLSTTGWPEVGTKCRTMSIKVAQRVSKSLGNEGHKIVTKGLKKLP